MSWYYAGPDAKPVGPVSLDELQRLRLGGAITPETYVIEQSGAPGVSLAWRHYRDVFPASASLPPVPGMPAPGIPAPGAPASASDLPPPARTLPAGSPQMPAPAPHPLFPSAAHAPLHQPPPPVMHAAGPHGYFPVRRTNSWCAWGFGLGIAGFILTFACGLGLLIAAPALLICILGFVQVQRHPDQSGRGLAVAGGILSALALLISIGFLAYAVPVMIKNHSWTVTEQSSSNSE